MKNVGLTLFLVLLLAGVGCQRDGGETGRQTSKAGAAQVSARSEPLLITPSEQLTEKDAKQNQNKLPKLIVHKSPTCGCCQLWIDHMSAEGFDVEIVNTNQMNQVKSSLGVPSQHGSCHTAQVGGYFVEGHVPAQDVKRMLSERPKARGLAVPGMPLGSPGMEAGGRKQAYDTLLVTEDGVNVWAKHNK